MKYATVDDFQGFVDVTSEFTLNTTYCSSFKAYTNGYVMYVSGIAKTNSADQTTLVTVPTKYKDKLGIGWIPFACLWLNIGDATKSPSVYLVDTIIQIRVTSAITGTGGIAFAGSWVII